MDPPLSQKGALTAAGDLRSSTGRLAGLPPIGLLALLAQPLKRARGALPVAAGLAAELPELARRALVTVDQLVELERVDLAAVKSREPLANVLKQREQLLLVIVGDERSRLLTSGAFLLAAAVLDTHAGKVLLTTGPWWGNRPRDRALGAADLRDPSAEGFAGSSSPRQRRAQRGRRPSLTPSGAEG
jgi:hypothetical protein